MNSPPGPSQQRHVTRSNRSPFCEYQEHAEDVFPWTTEPVSVSMSQDGRVRLALGANFQQRDTGAVHEFFMRQNANPPERAIDVIVHDAIVGQDDLWSDLVATLGLLVMTLVHGPGLNFMFPNSQSGVDIVMLIRESWRRTIVRVTLTRPTIEGTRNLGRIISTLPSLTTLHLIPHQTSPSSGDTRVWFVEQLQTGLFIQLRTLVFPNSLVDNPVLDAVARLPALRHLTITADPYARPTLCQPLFPVFSEGFAMLRELSIRATNEDAALILWALNLGESLADGPQIDVNDQGMTENIFTDGFPSLQDIII